jgi:hypothetical protein
LLELLFLLIVFRLRGDFFVFRMAVPFKDSRVTILLVTLMVVLVLGLVSKLRFRLRLGFLIRPIVRHGMSMSNP